MDFTIQSNELAAAFRHHAFIQAMNWMGILAVLGVILMGTAIYLVFGPFIRIYRLNWKIMELKRRRDITGNFTR